MGSGGAGGARKCMKQPTVPLFLIGAARDGAPDPIIVKQHGRMSLAMCLCCPVAQCAVRENSVKLAHSGRANQKLRTLPEHRFSRSCVIFHLAEGIAAIKNW